MHSVKRELRTGFGSAPTVFSIRIRREIPYNLILRKRRKKRTESDFLKYKDSQGKFAAVHGPRYTFITNLPLNGVDPQTAQPLARLSTMALTMNVYTHLNDKKQIDAINLLFSPKEFSEKGSNSEKIPQESK